ncbi:NAD-dependent epimerase/dehydratase family protein [Polaribacter vadi]|uniref:NAD-dependent epimerase/dehydratase family protein n=1 Tax=Polaribacter vadi TaxID=1774273 RepID=UPI0030EEC722
MGIINLKDKKVIVVGGNGYLGSFLIKALKEQEANVFIISRNCEASNSQFIVDITNFEETNTIIQKIKPDIVYHLAANISRNRDFSIYENMAAVNVQGTLNLLKSLEGIDAHFIFTSSSEIYGNNESPFQENQIPKPVSPYSLSKINAEILIQTYCTNHQKKFTNLRVFNFYGEHMPEEFFIPQMINSLKKEEDFLMTKGEQVRDFLYVSDVVSALILSAQNTNAYGETMNVCSGKGTKLSTLAAAVNNSMKTKAKIILGAIPYRDNEVWEMIGDNSKIKNKIGFKPTVSIEKGIEIVINKS